MGHSTNANAMFFGGLYAAERPYVLKLLKACRAYGFTRFVEPCSGILAGCVTAKAAGFDTAEASDVVLLPSIVGNAVAGNDLSKLDFTINGKIPDSAEDALFAIKERMMAKNSWNENGACQYHDFMLRKDSVKEDFREFIKNLRNSVPDNFTYEPLDLFEHIERVKDDPSAVVWLWPPTYKGNYESLYSDADGIINWQGEPWYSIWDPETGYDEVMERYKDAKCLLIMGEESDRAHGHAIYGRNSGRDGVYTYIVTNKPELVEEICGKGIFRPNPAKEQGNLWELFNEDVKPDSKIEIVPLTPEQCRHYKKVLIKRFMQSNTTDGYAMLIDGKLAGVFGYMDVGILLGGSKYAMQAFALTVPGHRLARLNTMVAAQRQQLEMHYDALTMSQLVGVRSLTITDKPMSMELRGIAKLVDKRRDGKGRNVLVYEMEIGELSLDEVRDKFLESVKRAGTSRKRRDRGRARGRNRPSEGAK